MSNLIKKKNLMRVPFSEMNYQFDHLVKCNEFEGLKLQSYCQESKGNPVAIIYFLHGYGDYCKNYGYLFQKLSDQYGIATYALDRRGFGESQGRRGDIIDQSTLIQDYWQFIDSVAYLRGHHHNTPKFLLGHSIGALYSMRLCQKRHNFFKGCIMVNPLFEFKNKLNKIQIAMLKAQKLMQYNERQKFPKMDKFLPEELIKIRQQQDDLYIETKMSVESYLQILNLQEDVYEEQDEMKTNFLMILGQNDDHACNLKANELFDQIKDVQSKQKVEIRDQNSDHFMICWQDQWQQIQNETITFIQKIIQRR